MSKKAVDNFKNGVFWELYNDLERQFQSFLEYVPYLPGNETVYSFKLLNLILTIGGHVDSAFKEMARYPKFSGNDDCKDILEKVKKKQTVPITLPLKAFETEYKLSEKTIIFKRLPERQNVKPFKPRSGRAQSPKWWKVYNGIKHDVSVNIKEANLQTTRDALAGAFLLNVVHKPGILRLYDYGMIKFPLQPIEGPFAGAFEYAMTRIPRHMFQDMLERDQSFGAYVETALFVYDYSQGEEDEDE